VNLDNRRWDRPDQDCELQRARGIPAIFKWTRQKGMDPISVTLAEVRVGGWHGRYGGHR
jgi:hypothetical protein